MSKIPKMITLLEASELSGLSYDRLRKLCLAGKVVYIRSGRKILINADKLAEYLNHGDTDTSNVFAHESELCSCEEGSNNG